MNLLLKYAHLEAARSYRIDQRELTSKCQTVISL